MVSLRFIRFQAILDDQRWLYVAAVVVLMLPSVVLSFTDPIPAVAWPAFFLLPLSCYLLLLLLFRKPGYGLLPLLPLLLVAGTQLVLLWLFGGSIISVDMFLNFFIADPSEAGELMSTIWPLVLCACLLYLPFIAWAVRSVRNSRRLSKRFVIVALAVALLCGGAGSVSAWMSTRRDSGYSVLKAVYPVNVVENIRFAVQKLWKSYVYPDKVRAFTFQADKPGSEGREIYLLVIGETSRAANWSAYGYERETNPCLTVDPGVLFFRNVFTQANITHRSVPIILSCASAENYSVIYRQKSLLTAFKEAGFTTCFLSNQAPDKSFIDYFAAEADSLIRIREAGVNTYDGELLPYLKRMIDATPGNLCIVLHTYGSHFEYNMRYPRSFAFYTPDESKRLSIQNRENYINAYDNSIRYTDWFLEQVIDTLRASGDCSALLYLSDHGEDILDDERQQFLHCSPVPSAYQLHIPFVCWFSEAYRDRYPAKVATAESHLRIPCTSNVVFHTLIDLSGIRTPYLEPSLSIVNTAFSPGAPCFINDWDQSIPVRELKFKPQDTEWLRKNGLLY